MAEAKRARGRPKGTGINDEPALKKIAALLAGDADLKPTTAIRQLGYTNASEIRRLRDKYKVRSAPNGLEGRGKSAVRKVKPTQVGSVESGCPSMAPAVAAGADTAQSCHAARPGPDGATVAIPWVEFATRFALLAAQGHLAVAQCVLRHPSMPFVIEQQARVMNTMLSLCFSAPSDPNRSDETSR
jgi:hypothetical protein